jgi:hypothetical protein
VTAEQTTGIFRTLKADRKRLDAVKPLAAEVKAARVAFAAARTESEQTKAVVDLLSAALKIERWYDHVTAHERKHTEG